MGAEWWLRRPPLESNDDEDDNSLPILPSEAKPNVEPGQVQGVVKARASTNNDVSIMWEGRVRNMLVSLGVVSDLSNRSKPIKAIGLELSYFASG